MTPESVALALVAVAILAALVVFWRLTNSAGQISWDMQTREPASSLARVERERDEARRVAEQLRAELDRAPTIPPLEHSRGHE